MNFLPVYQIQSGTCDHATCFLAASSTSSLAQKFPQETLLTLEFGDDEYEISSTLDADVVLNAWAVPNWGRRMRVSWDKSSYKKWLRYAKSRFPKEAIAVLLGYCDGEYVSIYGVYIPPQVAGLLTVDMHSHSGLGVYHDAVRYIKSSDLIPGIEPIGTIHTHCPMNYEFDASPSLNDIFAQSPWEMIWAIQVLRRKGGRIYAEKPYFYQRIVCTRPDFF